MAEASQIDWAGHANNKDASVNEMFFDRAIKIAFDSGSEPKYVVIITADHETGGMALPGGDLASGEVEATYATTGHTSVMVPVFAYGAGAIEFAGIYENTDIFSKILTLYDFAE